MVMDYLKISQMLPDFPLALARTNHCLVNCQVTPPP